jgi:DNA-binding transcriptional ArsR family regulator
MTTQAQNKIPTTQKSKPVKKIAPKKTLAIAPQNQSSTAPSMDEAAAVKALAALAQAQRLRTFRALVVAGSQGLTPGAIAQQLDLAPSTLSFHLKELTNSALLNSQALGRNLIYRVDFLQVQALLTYLSENCCEGQSCEVSKTAICISAGEVPKPKIKTTAKTLKNETGKAFTKLATSAKSSTATKKNPALNRKHFIPKS